MTMAKKILCEPTFKDVYAILETNKLTGMSTWYGPLYQTYRDANSTLSEIERSYVDTCKNAVAKGGSFRRYIIEGVVDIQISVGNELVLCKSFEIVKRIVK